MDGVCASTTGSFDGTLTGVGEYVAAGEESMVVMKFSSESTGARKEG